MRRANSNVFQDRLRKLLELQQSGRRLDTGESEILVDCESLDALTNAMRIA